jgi:hypothetical protein
MNFSFSVFAKFPTLTLYEDNKDEDEDDDGYLWGRF